MTPERSRALAVVLGLTAIASYGLLRWFAPPESAREAPAQARQDNEIRGVEMRVYDANGAPNLILVSPRIVSPRRSDEYLIETPVFELISDAKGAWHGQSRIGRLDVTRDRLWLEEDVRLRGEREARPPVAISGERMEFRLSEKLALSEEAVEIRQPGSELRGVGMRADLNQDRFVLRSKVEGVYVPQRKRP